MSTPRRWRLLGVLCLLAVFGTVGQLGSGRAGASASAPLGRSARCPWATASVEADNTPTELAEMVLAKMTLQDKLDVVDLAPGHGYENRSTPIPSLCIPALTLQDGPNGLSRGDRGVTQLPASIGLAASFDLGLAKSYGEVQGNEARRQGIDVVQGPNLNLARVPESGRIFEGYGEDPYLASAMGVADIEGIQSEGVMADAKHFTAYNQEIDRGSLNQDVSARALQELYLAPFKAAVTEAHVASIMCAYGKLNGTETCADPKLYRLLAHDWGFQGFVRSDLNAVANPVQAFAAGLDVIKPAAPRALKRGLSDGLLSKARLEQAVTRVLAEMFAYHLISHPFTGHFDERVTNAAHAKVALHAAEESMVLLKNNGTLPLDSSKLRSVAVIGADASSEVLSAGSGSAYVIPPTISRPLNALKQALGHKVKVTDTEGGSQLTEGTPLAGDVLPVSTGLRPGIGTAEIATHAAIGTGNLSLGEKGMRHWTTEARAPETGTYVVSVADDGDTWLDLDGAPTFSSPGQHGRSVWSMTEFFRAGQQINFGLSWYALPGEDRPSVSLRYAGSEITDAAAAARRASAAVVYVSVPSSEGTDRPNLNLPSDENALITAVAAANPHTVVVLNSPGAVLMPWLSKVAAVLEAWYPGQEDGKAVAAVLTGSVDPSGRLPLTFPASNSEVPTSTPASWPGLDGTVHYSEGLDIGYRYDNAHGLTPLFPFGYGLSYTRFSLSSLGLTRVSGGFDANVTVTNAGRRSGAEVVQAYLSFPAVAGEPPDGLVSFGRVTLGAGKTKTIELSIPDSAFSCFLDSGWQEVPGTYVLRVGTSSADLPLTLSLSGPNEPGALGLGGTLGAVPLPVSGPIGAPGPTGVLPVTSGAEGSGATAT